jgi:IS30 family transposase
MSTRELSELWERWRSGESMTSISRALGRSITSVEDAIAAKGGIPPVPRRRSKRVLSLEEREEILRGVTLGLSLRDIAARLRRAPSTICREIRRHGGRARYRATRADRRAWRWAARPKPCRLAQHPRLCQAVAGQLLQQWSPEQISAWLVLTYPSDQSMRVSHETIYRTLFIQARGALKKELLAHLRTHRVRRRTHQAQRARGGSISGELSIRDRPAEAEDRAVPGHWEGDLISGSHNSHIATLVERRSRFVMLVKVRDQNSVHVAQALARKITQLPPTLRRSLTWDRGIEMAAHQAFTVATDVKVYFCDPYSPWQRGSNENTNGLLRQYFKKGTDLSVYSQRQLDAVALRLNQRPRQTLGFHTPAYTLGQNVASTG